VLKNHQTLWGEWNNYYPSSRTNKLPDIIAKIGGIWGKREGADNNYSVTNWNIELGGTSGHMGVLYPLLPLELKQE